MKKRLVWILYGEKRRVNGEKTLNVKYIVRVLFEPSSAVKSLALPYYKME